MAKSTRRRRKANKIDLASRNPSSHRALRGKLGETASTDAIKAAEEVAMAAFSSGLRLAAAFGTAAAKTASLTLASLATGADQFSELVRKEAMGRSPYSRQGKRPPHIRKLSSRKRRSPQD